MAYPGTELSHPFVYSIFLELTQNKIPITMFSKDIFIFWQTSCIRRSRKVLFVLEILTM